MSNLEHINGELIPQVFFEKADLSKVKNISMAWINEDGLVETYVYHETWQRRVLCEKSIQDKYVLDLVSVNLVEEIDE